MKIINLLLISISFLFFSCDLLIENTSGDSDLLPIESTIHVDIREVLDPENPTLTLELWTGASYPCVNYWIEKDYEKTGNTIYLNLKGIREPEICLTAIGPAFAHIDLGSLANGTFDLRFILRGEIITGQLKITDDKFEFSFPHSDILSIEREVMRRVPEYTIWGITGYHRETSAHFAESFRLSLESAEAQSLQLPVGDYRYFVITEDYDMYMPGNFGYWFHEFFIYRYEHSLSEIEEVVGHYGREYGDSLSVAVHTWRGDSFYSWVLGRDE